MKRYFVASILLGFVLPFFVSAQQSQPCIQTCSGNAICNPLKFCNFEGLINTIIDFIFWAGIVVGPLMVIIAAIYFVISAGDPGKVKTAKEIIIYTAVGLLIILLAKGLVGVIMGTLTR